MTWTWTPPKDFVRGNDVFPFERPWAGQMLYTGPGGIGDCRAHLLVDSRAIGTNQYSFEGTHDADYLWRPAPGTPFQSPRYKCPGEIGWGSWIRPIEDSKAPNTGHQILTSEFWRQVEDEFTHRFQSPWYWHPTETKTPPGFEKPFGPHGYVPPRPRITRTSSSSSSASPLTSRSVMSRGRLWRRAPDTTQTTVYDLDTAGSEEQSESSGFGSRAIRFRPSKQFEQPIPRANSDVSVKGVPPYYPPDYNASTTDQSNNNNNNRPFTAPAPQRDVSANSRDRNFNNSSNRTFSPDKGNSQDGNGSGRLSRTAHARSVEPDPFQQQRHLV